MKNNGRLFLGLAIHLVARHLKPNIPALIFTNAAQTLDINAEFHITYEARILIS